jgi:predicted DNA-binding transcriptional regulator AlpA
MQQLISHTTVSTPAIMRLKEVAYYLQISLVTLWRMGEQDPNFPKKIRMNSRCVGYLKTDIDVWLANKSGGGA